MYQIYVAQSSTYFKSIHIFYKMHVMEYIACV